MIVSIGGFRRPWKEEASESTGNCGKQNEKMHALNDQLPPAICDRDLPFGGPALSRQRESIGDTCSKPFSGNPSAPNQLPCTEPHAFALREELAERRARRMADHDVVGVANRDTGQRASLAEFVVSPRLEAFIEPADLVEHSPLDEKVGRGAEALLDVPTLTKKSARVHQFWRRGRARQLELDPTGHTRCGREPGEPSFNPVLMRATIDIGECHEIG